MLREIKEETGISLEKNEVNNPFFEIDYYDKNYHDTGINRLSRVIYYLVNTNKTIDLTKTNYTEEEKKNKFKLLEIKRNTFENNIKDCIKSSNIEINRVIAEEILIAFNELKKVVIK